jgi:hypothetical protein
MAGRPVTVMPLGSIKAVGIAAASRAPPDESRPKLLMLDPRYGGTSRHGDAARQHQGCPDCGRVAGAGEPRPKLLMLYPSADPSP